MAICARMGKDDMTHNPENCKEIFALLSDYLNLELPPDACEQIERHLADCPPCVEFAESLRQTVDLCRGYADVVPAPLTAAARAELEQAWRKMLSVRQSPPATGPSR